MGKTDLSKPLNNISFKCSHCGHSFSAAPDRIGDAPERDWHPWEYFAECPACLSSASQAHWEVNLMKARPLATGPRTPEGKAASAANLDGHPTPEEAQRTRFNALKHGLFARTASYFPARPGGYPQCEGCEHEEEESCKPYNACLKQTELFMRHQAAFDSKDPGLLTQLRGDTQAAIQALINDMVFNIAKAGGTMLSSPEYYYDKEGTCHWVKYTDENGERRQLFKLEAHPLLKPLMDFISKNNMTLSDMEMTPKVQDEQEMLKGYLTDEKEQEKAGEYMARIEQQNSVLLNLVGNYEANKEKVINAQPEALDHEPAG